MLMMMMIMMVKDDGLDVVVMYLMLLDALMNYLTNCMTYGV